MTATKKRPRNLTSHTELSKLAQCEMSWKLRYVDGVKGEPSDPMWLGTLVHRGAAAISLGGDWRQALAEAITEEGADPSLVVLEALDADTPAATARWLLERYERHYADDLADVTVVAQELDLRATIPGTKQVHQAIIDEVWDVAGDIWVVERKTFGRNDRLDYVEVDPQLTNNLWVARANGIDAVGIVFDGIYTYRWKPEKPTLGAIEEKLVACGYQGTKKDLREQARGVQADESNWVERPDSDSFTRLWLDRQPEHVEAAQTEIRGAISRRNALRRGAHPTRNIGNNCRYCDQRSACWEMLAFPQEIVLDAD